MIYNNLSGKNDSMFRRYNKINELGFIKDDFNEEERKKRK